LPMSARRTPGATAQRTPWTVWPKMVPATWVPCPSWSPSPSPVKSFWISSTPRNASWPASMLGTRAGSRVIPVLHPGPVARGPGWVEALSAPRFETEVEAIRRCLRRDVGLEVVGKPDRDEPGLGILAPSARQRVTDQRQAG
jgi:hypothetical protein